MVNPSRVSYIDPINEAAYFDSLVNLINNTPVRSQHPMYIFHTNDQNQIEIKSFDPDLDSWEVLGSIQIENQSLVFKFRGNEYEGLPAVRQIERFLPYSNIKPQTIAAQENSKEENNNMRKGRCSII